MADGRWLVMRAHPLNRHPALRILLFLSAVAVAVALGAYPVTRRLTRRIERLQSGVDFLGGGDLSARVKVEGSDEVARLARSFNRAAARIEELVSAHKLLLANASHELRTPLSRIRLGVELIKETADPKRKAELENDIAELDQLLDEILLASRLDAVTQLDVIEEVDLLALAAEECARFDECSLTGEQATVQGDPKLLRRMIRNLLENAKTSWIAALRGGIALCGKTGGAHRVRQRVGHSGRGTRARVFAVLPGGAGQETERRRAGACACETDRATAWRAGFNRAARRMAELFSGKFANLVTPCA